MYRKIFLLIVGLFFIVSLANSRPMFVYPDGSVWDAYKEDGIYKVRGDRPVSHDRMGKSDTVYIYNWDFPATGYYFPNRGPGTLNMQWFIPPAECKLMQVELYMNSGGNADAWLWLFPYVPGMSGADALDSISTYFVYDSTGVGAHPDGWVAMPETLAGPMPLTVPGGGGWATVSFDPFGGPFDVGMDAVFFGYIYTQSDGDPTPLSDARAGNYLPCRSYQFRTTVLPAGDPAYDWRDYGDYVGDWCWRMLVDMYGDPPPEIVHEKKSDTYAFGPYTIDAEITDNSLGIERAHLYWTLNPTEIPPTTYDSVAMSGTYPDYTADIAVSASVGDTIAYWIEAADTMEAIDPDRKGRWPIMGKAVPARFYVQEKVGNVLFVWGDDNADPNSYWDVLDSLHLNYDFWDIPGGVVGYSQEAPDSSVLNAGYDGIIWASYSGMAFERATREGFLAQYLDNDGNLLLAGQDIFANIYGYDPVSTAPGEFAYDYLHFTWVWDDAINDTLPRYIYGAAGDPIAGPFETDLIFYDPMNTWSGQDIWCGTCSLDVADPPVEIFFDESDVSVGYRYVAPGGYRYVFLYYQFGAIADETTPDSLREVNFAQQYTLMENVLSWFATGVQETPSIPSPFVFALYQNRPNPVFSNATIYYSISNESKVNLKLYNAAGQVVKTLVNSVEKPGVKKVIWDGRDNRGSEVASGVYFYRLEAGDKAATRKLVLMR